jgi:hypothetical protein
METGEMYEYAKCWPINLKRGSHVRDVSIDWSTSASEGPEWESRLGDNYHDVFCGFPESLETSAWIIH